MAFRFPICQIERLVGNCPQWHENWSGLKTAHLWHRDAGRATGSFPTLPSRLLIPPSREVKEAFNNHQCEEYQRKPD